MKLRNRLFLFVLTFIVFSVSGYLQDAHAATKSQDRICSAAIAPDGNHLAFGREGHFSLKSNQAAETSVRLDKEDDNATVRTLVFSSDSAYLALGTSRGTVYLYDVNKGLGESQVLGQHDWEINYVTFSSNNRILISAAADGTIKFWSVRAKREIFSIADYHGFKSPGNVKAAAVSPNGQTLVTATANGKLQLWPVQRESVAKTPKKEISLRPGVYGKTYAKTLTFSPDNKHLAVGTEDGALLLWDSSNLTSVLTTIDENNFPIGNYSLFSRWNTIGSRYS